SSERSSSIRSLRNRNLRRETTPCANLGFTTRHSPLSTGLYGTVSSFLVDPFNNRLRLPTELVKTPRAPVGRHLYRTLPSRSPKLRQERHCIVRSRSSG